MELSWGLAVICMAGDGSMISVERFKTRARKCFGEAALATDPLQKVALLEQAARWTRLAADVEATGSDRAGQRSSA
jgi:hypothetical protein